MQDVWYPRTLQCAQDLASNKGRQLADFVRYWEDAVHEPANEVHVDVTEAPLDTHWIVRFPGFVGAANRYLNTNIGFWKWPEGVVNAIKPILVTLTIESTMRLRGQHQRNGNHIVTNENKGKVEMAVSLSWVGY